MRVLFVSNLFPPNVVGGYEVLCASVATEFARYGHEICVLTSSYGTNTLPVAGIRVVRGLRLEIGSTIYSPFDGSPIWQKEILRANIATWDSVLRDFQPDIVFCWNLYGLSIDFFDHMLGGGYQIVVMLTDNWLLSMRNPEFLQDYFANQVFCTDGEARPNIAPTKVVPVGAVFGSDYMRHLYKAGGIEFRSCTVVHNGVKSIAKAPALEFKEPTLHKRLLFAGRLVKIKGIETAIRAIARANSVAVDGAQYSLTIVGESHDPSYKEYLCEEIRRTGRSNLFEIRPPVPEHDLGKLFAAHDAYIFPSLYEPFSLTLIHALQSGTPVIASDAGGNPEIVENGVTGFLFNRGDDRALCNTIFKLFWDKEKACSMASKAAVRAAEFSFDRMISGMQRYLIECTKRND